MAEQTSEAKFIVVEGIDGSGATTQVGRIHKFLRTHNINSDATREPTNFLIGGLIRSWLSGDWSSSPFCLQLLFTADRAHHLEKEIIPLLEKGVCVVSDRYYYSTLAYGMLDIDDEQLLYDMNKHFIEPDLVFFLDLSAKQAIARMKEGRQSMEIFEKEQELQAVRENYKEIFSDKENVIVIDAGQEMEKVSQDIFYELRSRLEIS